jgi:hypothetical protein
MNTLSIMLNTSYAAALAVAEVSKKGAALPKLKTPMMITKKTSIIFPTVYSGLVILSLDIERDQPYQNPNAYALKITSHKNPRRAPLMNPFLMPNFLASSSFSSYLFI